RSRFAEDGSYGELADFVARQGALALERAERGLIGTQYKVPRFVSEDLTASPQFREAVAELAERLGRPVHEVEHEAGLCIDEMVASQSRVALDVRNVCGRW